MSKNSVEWEFVGLHIHTWDRIDIRFGYHYLVMTINSTVLFGWPSPQGQQIGSNTARIIHTQNFVSLLKLKSSEIEVIIMVIVIS